MGNSESRSPNDQVPPSTSSPHEDGCKEAEIKLIECAITLPEVRELATKALTEAFKAAAFHDEDKYMKGGACKESFMSLAECPDRDKLDMQMAMLDCMEDHSDYYHKYLEIVDEQMSKKAVKELESIFPGEEKEWALEVHKYFMKGKGGCCKEQYTGYTDCMIEKLCEEEQCGPFPEMRKLRKKEARTAREEGDRSQRERGHRYGDKRHRSLQQTGMSCKAQQWWRFGNDNQ